MKNKLILFVILIIILTLGIFIFNSNNNTTNNTIDNTSENNLTNTKWKLDSWYINKILPDNANITLNFDKNELNGNSGVNNYFTSYSLEDDNRIIIENISATEMASLDNMLNTTEQDYFNLLSNVKYYNLENNKLELLNSKKEPLLTFIKN